jgi:hypothetical protein
MRAALIVALSACMLVCAPSVQAEAACYPGVAPTAELPAIPMPSTWPPYWSIPDPTAPTWGFIYFFCLQDGKWTAYYDIANFVDFVPFLTAGQTLVQFVKQQTDALDALKTPQARRAFIDGFRVQYARNWGSCTGQITGNGPHADKCRTANNVAWNAKPADPPPPGPEVWRVKPTGTAATTRVVYRVLAGKLAGPTSPLRTVAVGTLCDQSIRIEASPSTYMGVSGGVAVCERQP